MGQPHKHAALIKAWADGAEIQVRIPSIGTQNSHWLDVSAPTWGYDCEYRIKPKTIKFRLALFGKLTDNTYVIAVNESSEVATKGSDNFIKWLGDWQEVAV